MHVDRMERAPNGEVETGVPHGDRECAAAPQTRASPLPVL